MSSEVLPRLVEAELVGKEPTQLELRELEGLINALRRVRATYSDDIHAAEVKLYESLAEALFSSRLAKYLDGKEVKGFDHELYNVIARVQEVFKDVVTGNYAGSGTRALFRVTQATVVHNYPVKPGDLVVSELNNVLKAVIAGYMDLVSLTRVKTDESS